MGAVYNARLHCGASGFANHRWVLVRLGTSGTGVVTCRETTPTPPRAGGHAAKATRNWSRREQPEQPRKRDTFVKTCGGDTCRYVFTSRLTHSGGVSESDVVVASQHGRRPGRPPRRTSFACTARRRRAWPLEHRAPRPPSTLKKGGVGGGSGALAYEVRVPCVRVL